MRITRKIFVACVLLVGLAGLLENFEVVTIASDLSLYVYGGLFFLGIASGVVDMMWEVFEKQRNMLRTITAYQDFIKQFKMEDDFDVFLAQTQIEE